MGSQAEGMQQGSGWRTRLGEAGAGRQERWQLLECVVPQLNADKPGRNNWGAKQTMQPSVPALGNKASKPLTEKNLWGPRQQEKLPDSQEFFGETHRVLECTQTHPYGSQHQKGPVCLWEVTDS